MNQGKKILFLTTSNLATNPRLVKEIDLAIQHGYLVSVICFSFNNWSKDLNDQIKERFGSSIHLKEISAGRKPVLPWVFSTLFQLLNKYFYLFVENKLSNISFALSKRTWLLHNELKKQREPVDFIVAHNPGSFYPAYTYSKKMKIPFGIDVEDYHPGETNQADQSAMMKKIMQGVLPAAAYVTTASPLILEKVKEDCKGELNSIETILNYFNGFEFQSPFSSVSDKLKLVWFSQNIDINRGLEEILPIVTEMTKEIELHIVGNLNPEFETKYITGKSGLVIHKPMHQKELHHFLANIDVGLAIEPGKDLNNTLAISNKLLAYYQAGLYILASDTIAQKQFLQQYPEHGIITSLRNEDLKMNIQNLIEQKNNLRQTSQQRFEKARSANSESELQKLSSIWSSLKWNTL